MYDVSNAGWQFRTLTCLSLAWWHSYKWTAKLLLKVFSADIFAPYFHHLYPNQAFNVESLSLSACATYMSYIRLAYPMIKPELMRVMATPNMDFRQKAMLRNVQDICECYIPVVIFICVIRLFVVPCCNPYMTRTDNVCMLVTNVEVLKMFVTCMTKLEIIEMELTPPITYIPNEIMTCIVHICFCNFIGNT